MCSAVAQCVCSLLPSNTFRLRACTTYRLALYAADPHAHSRDCVCIRGSTRAGTGQRNYPAATCGDCLRTKHRALVIRLRRVCCRMRNHEQHLYPDHSTQLVIARACFRHMRSRPSGCWEKPRRMRSRSRWRGGVPTGCAGPPHPAAPAPPS